MENKIPSLHNNNDPTPLLDLGTSQQAPTHCKSSTVSGGQGTESICDLSDVIFQC